MYIHVVCTESAKSFIDNTQFDVIVKVGMKNKFYMHWHWKRLLVQIFFPASTTIQIGCILIFFVCLSKRMNYAFNKNEHICICFCASNVNNWEELKNSSWAREREEKRHKANAGLWSKAQKRKSKQNAVNILKPATYFNK